MMDNPRARGYYGGVTSGPIFRAIAQRLSMTSSKFTRKPILRRPQGDEKLAVVPDVRTLQKNLARKMIEENDLKSQVFGKGEIVVRQSPEEGKRIEKGDVVTLVLNDASASTASGAVAVPDLRGMSLRRAINRLVIDDFEVKVQGSGVVRKQIPAPGQRARRGSAVQVLCEPQALSQATVY